MKKLFLIVASSLMLSSFAFAGGLLTNTNQHAAFLRILSRDAIIGIDGVYSNPAGLAFMRQGIHLSITWQAAFQKRLIHSENELYQKNVNNPSNKRFFKGKAVAPVVPSFQIACVFNEKWSVSTSFAVSGGGGKCDFEDGLSMFEELVAVKMAQAKAKNYALDQFMEGRQFYHGLQVGATYRPLRLLSVYAGVRGIWARCSYTGGIRDIKAEGKAASEYLGGLASMVPDGDMKNELMAGAILMKENFSLDCAQSGNGITPILGVDFKAGNLNMAAKYEFRTKIVLENDSENSVNVNMLMGDTYNDGAKHRSDIPSIFTLGAQYSLPKARINAGMHYYWDKKAKGTPTDVSENTWEASFGVEYDINEKLLVSSGLQRTQYGFKDGDIKETHFNINSTGLGIGFQYKFTEDMALNLGYMHNFYENHKLHTLAGSKNEYTRKNDVIGISLNFSI